MLPTVQSTPLLPPVPGLAATLPGTPGRRPASTPVLPAPASQGTSVFEDLPAEMVSHVAGHVFRASVNDPRHAVDSLACNQALRSTVADELQAAEVLRNIQASRNLPELCAAMGRIHNVFGPHRHGCLSAVLALVPRVNQAATLPEAFWAQLGELLPTVVPAAGCDIADPREDLMLQMIGSLRHGRPHALLYLEQVFTLAATMAPPGPRLANALLQWAGAVLANPFFTGISLEMLRVRLTEAAPATLQPRLQSLCGFSALVESNLPRTAPQTMATHLDALALVPAIDLPNHLRIVSLRWRHFSRANGVCKALHRTVFERLSDAHQIAFMQRKMSPFAPEEVALYLLAKVGKVPALTLLDVARRHEHHWLGELSPEHELLVYRLVTESIGTPGLAGVLHAAMTRLCVQHPRVGPFLARHSALAPPDLQAALNLRMGLEAVGCGDMPNSQDGALEAMSRRVDELLAFDQTPPSAAIETLVDMHVGWLNSRQRGQLIDRAMALPPATAARLLESIVAHLPHPPYFTQAVVLTRKAAEACDSLPPQLQAGPLASLLDLLVHREGPQFSELRFATCRMYHALPARLRPPFNRAWRMVLAPAQAAVVAMPMPAPVATRTL